MHADLRGWVATAASPDIAAAVRIIYGGSVKGSNCAELITLEDVDGGCMALLLLPCCHVSMVIFVFLLVWSVVYKGEANWGTRHEVSASRRSCLCVLSRGGQASWLVAHPSSPSSLRSSTAPGLHCKRLHCTTL